MTATHSLDEDRFRHALVGDPHPAVLQLEARLRRAQLDADVETLDLLIADDLLFAGPDGSLATKHGDLDAHASGSVRFLEHEPEELAVTAVREDVALASLRARLTVDVGGTTVSGVYRYTRLWVRNADGAWRVQGGHVSEIARGTAAPTVGMEASPDA